MPGVENLGDTLRSSVFIKINNTDINPLNNYDSLIQVLTGSVDPNDKLVKEGKGSEGYVLFNSPLTYTIRFQNTGTDTAFNVSIRDTIGNHMDLSTLKILASSHPVSLDLHGSSEVRFLFENILLPDSNVNEVASHGFVKYSIMPESNMSENTIVRNKAYIYFDFNPPILTNEVFNTFVSSMPGPSSVIETKDETGLLIYPNPGKGLFNLNIKSAEGQDILVAVYDNLGRMIFKEEQGKMNSKEYISD